MAIHATPVLKGHLCWTPEVIMVEANGLIFWFGPKPLEFAKRVAYEQGLELRVYENGRRRFDAYQKTK